jgi:siroheme synthase-like protein
MNVYPVCLINLHDKMCVVVGGGPVAERKVETLLACQARVTVISPTLTARLREEAEAGRLTYRARAYRCDDLEGAFLCIAATDDRAVNEQVWREGEARGVLVNTVDDVTHSHLITPAVLTRGDLTIAISTGGSSPALAARLKEELAALFGPEYAGLVQILDSLRPRLRAELGAQERRAFVNAAFDADVLSLLKAGERVRALAKLEEILKI